MIRIIGYSVKQFIKRLNYPQKGHLIIDKKTSTEYFGITSIIDFTRFFFKQIVALSVQF